MFAVWLKTNCVVLSNKYRDSNKVNVKFESNFFMSSENYTASDATPKNGSVYKLVPLFKLRSTSAAVGESV
jgi:hypothetical protein